MVVCYDGVASYILNVLSLLLEGVGYEGRMSDKGRLFLPERLAD